jgi:hypothetical protein
VGTVRIGTLGAARITPGALVKPARNSSEAELVAVAARDRTRADAFASKHGIPTVHDSYDTLLADPSIDAIYNPLPNGLHAEWTIAALEAGKHVLCEKPFTANAKEAEAVAAVASGTGLVVMEAFHYRYHPLAERMREIVERGELGQLRRVETALCFPLPKFSDSVLSTTSPAVRRWTSARTRCTWRACSDARSPKSPRPKPSCARPMSIARCGPSSRSRVDTPAASPARCGRRGSSRPRRVSRASGANCTSSTRRPHSSGTGCA